MHESILIELKKHLLSILKFVNGEVSSYTYRNLLTDEVTEYKDLNGYPCEFFLLLSNKKLCRKYIQGTKVKTDKSQLNLDLYIFINNVNYKWEYYTQDSLHPVPNSPDFNRDTFNASLCHTQSKAKGALWLKGYGKMRVAYIEHLLMYVDIALAYSDSE